MHRYNVLTYDMETGLFTPQQGMQQRCVDITLWEVRAALRELKDDFGYGCYRTRDETGHYDSDPSVLVVRVDDADKV